MAINPMASWSEGYGGGFLPGGGVSDLDARKKQLLQWLAGRGATSAGYRGSAVGRMGGLGGHGPLPDIQYNPFFAQIAGRNENFPFLPSGVSQAAAAAVQAGGVGPGMGLAPGATVSHAPIGGGSVPGVGVDAAPGAPQPHGGAAGRNLIGVGNPLPPGITPPLNPNAPLQLQPYDPYALRLSSIGARGAFRE